MDYTHLMLILLLTLAAWSRQSEAQVRKSLLKWSGDVAQAEAPDALSATRAAGRVAMAERRYQDAVHAFSRGVQASPADPGLLAGLGSAYLALGRYGNAISAYERALPSVLPGRTGIPLSLAHAYVAVNEDANAVRILRLAGTQEPDITDTIRRLRDVVARRQIPPIS